VILIILDLCFVDEYCCRWIIGYPSQGYLVFAGSVVFTGASYGYDRSDGVDGERPNFISGIVFRVYRANFNGVCPVF